METECIRLCLKAKHLIALLSADPCSHIKSGTLPLHCAPVTSVWYPLLQMHLYDPRVFVHLPFLHKFGMAMHSLISLKQKKAFISLSE